LLACVATWALGSALVLLRKRHGISRDAGQVGWVLIHFPLLLVCVRCVLGIFS